MLSGRSKKKKRKLMEMVTEAVVKALDVNPDSVRVIINEVPDENFSVAGMPIKEYRNLKKK